MFRKRIDSWARTRSIRYAYAAQAAVFKTYITKFIHKYSKLHTPNMAENPELFDYITEDDANVRLLSVIKQSRHALIHVLCFEYCLNRPLKSTQQHSYYKYPTFRGSVDDHVLGRARSVVNERHPTVDTYVTHVCEFAASLRMGFMHSDATAKAKVTEHWFDRLPLVVTFSLVSVGAKVCLELSSDAGAHAYVDVCIHAVMCMAATYMVFLRVPQAIFADAKKSASDVYIDHKTALYQRMLTWTCKCCMY
tara:strand:- start:736 stop:1485 length:750 start_codon:yes stop_codon:yes gene_type:complete